MPTYGHAKICYLEIPATDVPRSVAFYQAVFGWHVRKRGDGKLAFDDGVGEVSGSWVEGRPTSPTPGLLLYVMVDGVAAACEAVVAHGGRVVQPIGADHPEVTARFADPDGNVLGLYQDPGRRSEASELEREIVTSRVVDVPRERVFAAFADPVRLARWWGPKGFSSTFETFELRPGGRWSFVMHGPEGGHFPNESEFVEVEPPARIVFEHLSAPRFRMTIRFDEAGSGTRIDWRQRFESKLERDRIATFAVEANEQNLDRFEAELARDV